MLEDLPRRNLPHLAGMSAFDDFAPSRSLRRDVDAGFVDGTCFNVMVGIGETYFGAFVLALGLGQVAAGLVTTIPLLVGALLQMIAPWGVRRWGSPRRWVVLCASLQAASFLPMALLALWDDLPRGLVFALAAWYWGAGLATSAAWNTWMGALIPAHLRAKVFAWRTRLGQTGMLVGFVAGGLLLQAGTAWGRTLDAFALLFLVALTCRSISAAFLARQSEPPFTIAAHREVPWREWIARLTRSADGRLLLYLLAVQCSVHISGAYFTPYMIVHLKMSYAQFMLVIASAYAAKALSMPWIGRWALRWGPRRLLWLGGVGIIPLSGLWLVSNQFLYLVILQVVGGVAWAAYELSMALLFIEAIREDERTSVLTTFNVAWSIATVTGSLLGASILWLGSQQPAAYLTVFALSSLARILALSCLRRVPEFHRSPDLQRADQLLVETPRDVAQDPTPSGCEPLAA